MFAACPHCHFLIALHPQQRAVPAICPRCGKRVEDDPPPTAEAWEEMPSAPSPASAPDAESDAAPHKPGASIVDNGPFADGVVLQEDNGEPTEIQNSDAGETSEVRSPSDAEIITAPAERSPSGRTVHAKTALPSFTRGRRTTAVQTRVPAWQWSALIVLSLSLAIQTLLADRARLAADAGWRPLITRLCGVFHCAVPVWRQPEAFTMLSRDVRPVSDSPGTLQAQATFRNDARWAQAWPIVLLTLKDADGRTLGARALTPQEYLDAGLVQSEIAPGQSAQIAVRIREPSANVVAFSFDFR